MRRFLRHKFETQIKHSIFLFTRKALNCETPLYVSSRLFFIRHAMLLDRASHSSQHYIQTFSRTSTIDRAGNNHKILDPQAPAALVHIRYVWLILYPIVPYFLRMERLVDVPTIVRYPLCMGSTSLLSCQSRLVLMIANDPGTQDDQQD